jgi:hypothetical protein
MPAIAARVLPAGCVDAYEHIRGGKSRIGDYFTAGIQGGDAATKCDTEISPRRARRVHGAHRAGRFLDGKLLPRRPRCLNGDISEISLPWRCKLFSSSKLFAPGPLAFADSGSAATIYAEDSRPVR